MYVSERDSSRFCMRDQIEDLDVFEEKETISLCIRDGFGGLNGLEKEKIISLCIRGRNWGLHVLGVSFIQEGMQLGTDVVVLDLAALILSILLFEVFLL